MGSDATPYNEDILEIIREESEAENIQNLHETIKQRFLSKWKQLFGHLVA